MAYATLLTGPERRRRWPDEERGRILAAAFAPGAVVTQVARENDVSTALIYKWRGQRRRDHEGFNGFSPVMVAREPGPPPRGETVSITVDLVAGGARVSIGAGASAALVTATLKALK
jgi:transposase